MSPVCDWCKHLPACDGSRSAAFNAGELGATRPCEVAPAPPAARRESFQGELLSVDFDDEGDSRVAFAVADPAAEFRAGTYRITYESAPVAASSVSTGRREAS